MLLDDLANLLQLNLGKAMAPGKLDLRFKPEFRLPIRGMHMDMHAGFLARKEKEAVSVFPKNSWAHDGIKPKLHGIPTLKCLQEATGLGRAGW